MTVAGDIGPVVNLSGAENQVEGSVVDGFSTALGLELSIENGRIQETNFDRYPLLRIPHAPAVEVHFIQSDFSPTGVGEPALPPVAPAICNAIFAATGHRVRTLPLSQRRLQGLSCSDARRRSIARTRVRCRERRRASSPASTGWRA